jgi:hypothetical protein
MRSSAGGALTGAGVENAAGGVEGWHSARQIIASNSTPRSAPWSKREGSRSRSRTRLASLRHSTSRTATRLLWFVWERGFEAGFRPHAEDLLHRGGAVPNGFPDRLYARNGWTKVLKAGIVIAYFSTMMAVGIALAPTHQARPQDLIPWGARW